MRAELAELQRLESQKDQAKSDGELDDQLAKLKELKEANRAEDISRKKSLELQARQLRQDLLKWQHQSEVLEAELPQHEQEIVRIKAELTHASDILESTRHSIRHMEVELGGQEVKPIADGQGHQSQMSSHSAFPSAVEAEAERRVRHKTEEKNTMLSSKARRLTGVLASQALLIQRLEKQLAKEESQLEQQEQRLVNEERLQAHLSSVMRRRNDEIVLATLLSKGSVKRSVPSVKPSFSAPLLDGGDAGRGDRSPVSELPKIEEHR